MSFFHEILVTKPDFPRVPTPDSYISSNTSKIWANPPFSTTVLPQVMQFSSRTVTWKLAHSRETRGVDDTGANMQNELMHKVA